MTFRFKVSSENTYRSRAKTSQISSENGYMYGFGDVGIWAFSWGLGHCITNT